MRRAARTDANQNRIITAAMAMGASVQSLSPVGAGCPDLVIGYRGFNLLCEVKDPDKAPSERKLTAYQRRWHRGWRGQVCVIETPEDLAKLFGWVDGIVERLAA